jgi:hypothetical protein
LSGVDLDQDWCEDGEDEVLSVWEDNDDDDDEVDDDERAQFSVST